MYVCINVCYVADARRTGACRSRSWRRWPMARSPRQRGCLSISRDPPRRISGFLELEFTHEFSTLEVHLGSPFNWHDVSMSASPYGVRIIWVAW